MIFVEKSAPRFSGDIIVMSLCKPLFALLHFAVIY